MNKKQLEYFIMTDKHSLLKDNESFISYQFKRLWYFIKFILAYKW